jgi:putative membrane protein
MVKPLMQEDKSAIAAAIKQAEARTAADIVVAVVPASDAYLAHRMLWGMALGSVIAALLWGAHVLPGGWPLLVQPLVTLAACFISLWPFVPRHLREHRAAQRAYEEFVAVTRHAPPEAPVALLFVSLAERYAHILATRRVQVAVEDAAWDGVIAAFTQTAKRQGLRCACTGAIASIAEILAHAFPYQGAAHALPDEVIERER